MTDRRRPASWTATSAYRLGSYWQESGDYERAEAAYLEVLNEIPRHVPTLFNLSVTRIRRGNYRGALETMDRLAEVDAGVPERVLNDDATAKSWSAMGCSVAYNRALALHYVGQHEEAAKWARLLADRVLTSTGKLSLVSRKAERQAMERLEPSALMLYASLHTVAHARGDEELLKSLHDGALRETSAIDRALNDELPGASDEDRDRRDLLRRELEEPSAPRHLEWYVRLKAKGDARACYNLACYAARLSSLVPDEADADELRRRGVDHAALALRDARLTPWAKQDPALQPLEARREWQQLLETATDEESPTPAAAPPSDDDVDWRSLSEADRHRVIEQALVVLEHVDATASRSKEVRERLGRIAGADSERDLISVFASVRDPLTAFVVPRRSGRVDATLPIALERCFDADGEAHYLIAAVADHYTKLVPRGAEVTHWNGVPIAAAIEIRTGLIGAGSADSRRARAAAVLTQWPADLFGPPETDIVAVRYHSEGSDEDVRLRWRPGARRDREAKSNRGPVSFDPLADAVRAARQGSARAFEARPIPGHESYGHLRLRHFDVDDADAFVDEIAHAVSRLPEDGLVVDMRGNPGGLIAAAERLLQLFSPTAVRPQGLRARASDLMLRVANATEDLRHWRAPLEAAINAEQPVTSPFELTPGHAAACDRVWQVYHGPIGLILDALTGGAADFFVAGFLEHRLGPVVGVDDMPATGVRPAEVWSHAQLVRILDGHPLAALPGNASFCFPVRRAEGNATLVGGIERHRRTRGDVLGDDAELLATAVAALEPAPGRALRPSLEFVPGKRLSGTVETRGLKRVRVRVDGREQERFGDGEHRIDMQLTGDGPYVVELVGDDGGDDVIARRRLTLGGL